MGKKVSRHNALAALLAAPTIKEAAVMCGVAEKTMHQWLREPELQTELQIARGEMASAAMQEVLAAVSKAIAMLETIMQDATAPPMPRVVAAKTLLDGAIRAAGIQAMERRLQELEARPPVPVIVDDVPPWIDGPLSP